MSRGRIGLGSLRPHACYEQVPVPSARLTDSKDYFSTAVEFRHSQVALESVIPRLPITIFSNTAVRLLVRLAIDIVIKHMPHEAIPKILIFRKDL